MTPHPSLPQATRTFVVGRRPPIRRYCCSTMVVSPRGQVLAEAPAGKAATLELTIDLADTRDGSLSQQRDDVVSVTWRM